MLDVWRKNTFGDILVMSCEFGDGLEVGKVSGVGHFPDVAVSLVVGSDKGGAIVGDGHRADGDVFFRDQFMCAGGFAEVPEFDGPVLVAGDEFALIWVDYHVIHGGFVVKVPLRIRTPIGNG